jgi:hypothetical protein
VLVLVLMSLLGTQRSVELNRRDIGRLNGQA